MRLKLSWALATAAWVCATCACACCSWAWDCATCACACCNCAWVCATCASAWRTLVGSVCSSSSVWATDCCALARACAMAWPAAPWSARNSSWSSTAIRSPALTHCPSSTARLTMRPVILLPTTTSLPSTVPVSTSVCGRGRCVPPDRRGDGHNQQRKDRSFHAEDLILAKIHCKPNHWESKVTHAGAHQSACLERSPVLRGSGSRLRRTEAGDRRMRILIGESSVWRTTP